MTLHECERARYVATQALELWRGRPLQTWSAWEPGVTEAHRLEEVHAELEELVVEASLESGHHAEVLARAAAMVEAAPLRERRWALLARAQYLAGRQTEALRTLRRVRVVLARDLGLDPGPDLVALEQAILRQDPGLAVEQAATESRGRLAVPRARGLRRGGRRVVLRSRSRDPDLPGPPRHDPPAGRRRTLGERQVLPPASRARGGAAA